MRVRSSAIHRKAAHKKHRKAAHKKSGGTCPPLRIKRSMVYFEIRQLPPAERILLAKGCGLILGAGRDPDAVERAFTGDFGLSDFKAAAAENACKLLRQARIGFLAPLLRTATTRSACRIRQPVQPAAAWQRQARRMPLQPASAAVRPGGHCLFRSRCRRRLTGCSAGRAVGTGAVSAGFSAAGGV